jgi:hypothetical protein
VLSLTGCPPIYARWERFARFGSQKFYGSAPIGAGATSWCAQHLGGEDPTQTVSFETPSIRDEFWDSLRARLGAEFSETTETYTRAQSAMWPFVAAVALGCVVASGLYRGLPNDLNGWIAFAAFVGAFVVALRRAIWRLRYPAVFSTLRKLK